jgi:hypothetical protein
MFGHHPSHMVVVEEGQESRRDFVWVNPCFRQALRQFCRWCAVSNPCVRAQSGIGEHGGFKSPEDNGTEVTTRFMRVVQSV